MAQATPEQKEEDRNLFHLLEGTGIHIFYIYRTAFVCNQDGSGLYGFPDASQITELEIELG